MFWVLSLIEWPKSLSLKGPIPQSSCLSSADVVFHWPLLLNVEVLNGTLENPPQFSDQTWFSLSLQDSSNQIYPLSLVIKINHSKQWACSLLAPWCPLFPLSWFGGLGSTKWPGGVLILQVGGATVIKPSNPLLEALPPCGLKSTIQQSSQLPGWEAKILQGVIMYNRESSHFHFHPLILVMGKNPAM